MTPTKPAVIWNPSPNFNERLTSIDAIVIHHTASNNEAADLRQLTGTTLVSAHYLIGRDGSIWQLVADDKRAWHCGISALNGRRDVNDFSIGIELTNKGDGLTPFTEAQYEACRALIAWLCHEYAIPREHVVGHKDVALPKGRKDDPAANFEWHRVLPAEKEK